MCKMTDIVCCRFSGSQKNSTTTAESKRSHKPCKLRVRTHIDACDSDSLLPVQTSSSEHNQIRKRFKVLSKVALHCVWLNFIFDMIQFLDTTPCASVTGHHAR